MANSYYLELRLFSKLNKSRMFSCLLCDCFENALKRLNQLYFLDLKGSEVP